ncbi:cellulose synthase operon protein YhjQ, partial [Pseudomonas syringae pv. tagetis]
DVANLFQRFGASSDGYLEIANSLVYHESLAPGTHSVALQGATSHPSLEQPRTEQPAQVSATLLDSITTDTTRRTTSA